MIINHMYSNVYDGDHTDKQTDRGGCRLKRALVCSRGRFPTTYRDQNSHVSEIHVKTNLFSYRTETSVPLRLRPFK